MAENEVASRVSAPPRPTIALPPRSSIDNLFTGSFGLSPGPMTLVSSFFSENYSDSEHPSFSQLLAGAMGSPVAVVAGGGPSVFTSNSNDGSSKEVGSGDGGEKNLGFKQSRPMNLLVSHSPLFTVPPGLSPSGLLNSPALFSPGQSPFGMSHQQALAQVTAQAALSQSHMPIRAGYQPSSLVASTESLTDHPSFTANETTHQQMPLLTSGPKSSVMESSKVCHSDGKSQPPLLAADKHTDGYNWRKYGQKQVKGSEYPRSYYKCTHLNCPVKKKVERSHDGQITEIIYKGQHNHERPQPSKRAKDGNDLNGNANSQANPELGMLGQTEKLNRANGNVPADLVLGGNQDSILAIPVQSTGSSDSEEMGDDETRKENGDNDDEPNPKRRNTEQSPNHLSYYKCTGAGCNVRKHVERASMDPKAVITTYEGKHNHDVPAARNSSHNTANTNASQLKPHKVVATKHPLLKEMDFENKDQRSVAVLQPKEEQIKV
nr:WRKY [Loropetalum chinense var. rubrum]